MKRIILASQSPRRRTMLELLHIKFECCPADIDELFLSGEKPRDAVRRIAQSKAEQVREQVESGIIIAADTVVVCDGQMLGKPCDAQDAFDKLSILKGRKHEVITAICVTDAQSGIYEVQDETTKVYFRDMTDDEIRAYILTGEPMDKAGAYAIQGTGAVFIEKIEGCYFNVVGLPLKNLYLMLKRQGVSLLEV